MIERHPDGSMRLRSYQQFEMRVNTSHERGSEGDRVCAQALQRTQPFAISEIEEARPGLGRERVRLVLWAMKAAGLIASTGKAGGSSWDNITTGGVTEMLHA